MAASRDFPGTAGNDISIANPTGVLANAAWTFGCWINPDTYGADGRAILRVGEAGTTTRGFVIHHTNAGLLRWRQGGSAADAPIVAIGTGAWHTIGVTKAGSGVALIAFSRDGVSLGSNNMDPPTEITTGDVFRIGDNIGSLGIAPVDGEMAYAFWLQGVTLSAAATDAYLQDPEQLVTDYGPTGTVTANALKLYWPMQCDTATEEDESGVGNNGTRNGTVPLVLTGPTPTTAWDPCAAAGPTIDTQPVADTGLINGDATRRTTVYTVEASSVAVGGVTGITWNEDDTPIADGGVYDIVTTGLGTASASSTLTITRTVKTGTPFVLDADVTDADGTTASDAVNDTWYTGPVLSSTSGTTNASGVDTVDITSDYPNADGEFTVVTATAGGVTKQVALHYETPA